MTMSAVGGYMQKELAKLQNVLGEMGGCRGID
jgi:hypothetical protein